eukprot:CCRYP_002212-RE/>CCRYP_002212-RE protein AED:0.30 eAED:0.30 QI:0/0.66/0.57/1/0.5/0.28/7/1782/683
MRLQPISLLALPLSPPHLSSPRQRCPTILFTRGKQFDEAVAQEVAAHALKLNDLVPPPSPTQHASNNNHERTRTDTKGRRRRRRTPPRQRTNKNTNLTTRQKSISLGNDPLISLNLNLDHLAKSTQNPSSAIRAEEMLLRIEALHSDGYYEKPPDVVSYNCVINAYAHGRAIHDRLSNGERLVRRMVERGIVPNGVTYNTLLTCLLREMMMMEEEESHNGCTVDALRREKMEERNLANTISYNTMISILSKSRLDDSPQRAEYWLRRMMELYTASGEESVEPDVCSFNSVIHAYANQQQQQQQNTSFYAQRAEELLLEMETMYASRRQDSLRPDVVSYSAVIHAYARAASRGNEWCAEKAMQILEKLERNVRKSSEDGRKCVQPNKRTYASVIHAFARVGKAGAADAILSKMKKLSTEEDGEGLKPDTICYTSVIDAYAKKGGEEAAARAEELLREMESLYKLGDLGVSPNKRTYCAVISALGKSGCPRNAEKAEQILDEMERLSSTYGIRDLAPNTICYNAVIDAYARSTSVSKAYRTELLLERMLEESKNGNILIRPDTITFNSVINAAAQSTFGDGIVRKEAYLIALNAFKTLHSLDYCKPSSVTYSSFLKVLQNLVEKGDARDYMAEKVFRLSVGMGLDNDSVKLQLRRTCSSQVVAQRILESTVDATLESRGNQIDID